MDVLECCDPACVDGMPDLVMLQATTLLPDAEAPQTVICKTGDRRWLIADAEGVRQLDEDTVVRLHGRLWRLRTGEARPMLRFLASQDEEHVRLQFVRGATSIDLGERSHHQSLLLLARERRADAARGFASAECGWRGMDALERMLGIDAQHFNIHVFRARRQLAAALGAHGAPVELVERRAGQVRFAALEFQVQGGTPAA